MARPQVRDVSTPEPIQGIAQPVNTYVRPADPGRSQLADLAQGLASFDEGLSAFLQVRDQKTAEADKAKAIVDFHRNNEVGYAEAVREGLIPPTASRSYVEWYKKQQGNLAGLKLSDKFAVDYQQWEGRNGGDPAAFQQFVGDWMKQNVGEDQDPYVLSGLAPHLDRIATGGYDTFNQDRANSLRKNAQNTSGALLVDTLGRGADAGKVTGSIDYDRLWSGMMAQREEAISKGEKAEDFDKLIADSVILQAEEDNNPDILRILDKTVPGGTSALSSNLEVREAKLRALERIENKQASEATDIAQTREKLEKRQHEELLSQAVLALSNGEDVPEDTIKQLSRRDGEIRYKLAKYKKEYDDLETEEDAEALMQVYQEIDAGAGKEYVLQQREKGVIRDPATFIKAIDRVDAVRKANEGGGVFSSPTYKDTVKFITNATGAGDYSALDGVKGLTDEGLEALYDYRNMLLDWETKHPESSLLDKEKAAREMGDTIRERIKVDPVTLRGDYISDADRAKMEAEPQEPEPAVQPITEPEPQEGSYIPQTIRNLWNYFTGDGEEQPTGSQPERGEAALGEASQANPPQNQAPPIESLSPTTRQSLEAFAKKKGLSVDEAYGILSGRVQKLMPPQEVDPTTTDTVPANAGSISPETRTRLQGLLQDPPKRDRLTASNVPVAPLLDLIGGTEGTDKRNGYNETLGYGSFTGGDVDLVNMTLGDIDQLQTSMLRHPDNNLNSSALGRYQIVRTTLRGLKEEMGLTDDMKFTPELQDQMALHLLERRGLSKCMNGEISDEQFMNGLSAEWASLPRASGRGTYGQRLGTDVGGVRGALDRVRSGGTEVASLDPSIGMSSGDPYANIPDVDGAGRSGQKEKFREWNSDPVANNEANIRSLEPTLQDVVRRAQQIAPDTFVVGAGRRTSEQQKKAVEWGWSKTEDSDHLDGSAVDLWPLVNGAVKFDPKLQTQIVKAMKQAAKELGVTLDVGAKWKSFRDLPHFALKRNTKG